MGPAFQCFHFITICKVDPLPMVHTLPMVDPIPMVDLIPMVDPMPIVDPIPMVDLIILTCLPLTLSPFIPSPLDIVQ